MNYKGKHVLITNATSALGKALTRHLARTGAIVIALSSAPIELEILRAELLKESIHIHPYLWNDANPHAFQSILRTIHSHHGVLDHVFNNSAALMKNTANDEILRYTKNIVAIAPQKTPRSFNPASRSGDSISPAAIRNILKLTRSKKRNQPVINYIG